MTRLKIKRQQCKLSQSQLSKLSGVNVRLIQSYEQRERNINTASVSTILKLCNALRCDILDLLERETNDILDE